MNNHPVIKIAIFASGRGSNAQKIIDYFKPGREIAPGRSVQVALVFSNKADAPVLQIAEREGIPSMVLNKEKFFNTDHFTELLLATGIDFIVLAGFLWKIPPGLIRAYPDKILNIHPALLPAYGGKGMYGNHVHKAVIEAGEKESGITIHYVDEQYDHGKIYFQARCQIDPGETADSLAGKIHALEHTHFPATIARWIGSNYS
jgi:phosphoribosylglycinamide formyltransferase 1